MHIFKNTNFDFLRWRWHAIVLSWVVIIAGVVDVHDQGHSARRRVRRRHRRHRAVRSAGLSVQQVRAALDKRLPGGGQNVVVQAYGDPAQRQVMIRVPQVGAESGTSLSTTEAAGRGRARQGRASAAFKRQGTEIVGADGRPGAAQQGAAGDGAVAGRHPGVSRVPLPVQLRRRRGRRDDSRPADHAGVPGVLPLRHDAQRHRRDPDDDRLLDQRHDRHLRPDPREPARRCAATRCTTSSTRRSTRRSAGRSSRRARRC